MSRKTGNKWMTAVCGRCGDPHSGYSGKLDSHKIEYVICGSTHKRMDVENEILSLSHVYIPSIILHIQEKFLALSEDENLINFYSSLINRKVSSKRITIIVYTDMIHSYINFKIVAL